VDLDSGLVIEAEDEVPSSGFFGFDFAAPGSAGFDFDDGDSFGSVKDSHLSSPDFGVPAFQGEFFLFGVVGIS